MVQISNREARVDSMEPVLKSEKDVPMEEGIEDEDDSSEYSSSDDSSDESISDDEDGESVSMDELERWARHTLAATSGPRVTGKIHRNNSSPAISALFSQARQNEVKQEQSTMKRSDSLPQLSSFAPASLMARMQAAEMVGMDTMMRAKRDEAAKKPKKSPQDHLKTILQQKGVTVKKAQALDLVGTFFLNMNEENMKAYTFSKAKAVRNGDLDALRLIHEKGEMMQCCNQYRESIVHTACRRGSIDIVRFLIEEAHVSLRVVDDYGR